MVNVSIILCNMCSVFNNYIPCNQWTNFEFFDFLMLLSYLLVVILSSWDMLVAHLKVIFVLHNVMIYTLSIQFLQFNYHNFISSSLYLYIPFNHILHFTLNCNIFNTFVLLSLLFTIFTIPSSIVGLPPTLFSYCSLPWLFRG